MGKKMMILGASALQVPAIQAAKKLGYEIILVDYDEEAVGFPLADVKLVVSTLDMEEVYRQALIYRPDVVITSTSDGPVRTAAYVNEKLGKRPDLSYVDSLCATMKSHMRVRLKENHVPIPVSYAVENFADFRAAAEALGGRCIVKPSDNAGSRGVVTDKYITPPPYFVEIAHCEPSRLSEEQQEQIRETALQAIRAIRLQNGPSHTELKFTEEGPKVVEIAARLGGDFITSRLVPLSTGVDLVGASVLLATGEKPDLERKWQKGAAIHFIQGREGKLKRLEAGKEISCIDGVEEVAIYKKAGDITNGTKSSNDRLGHIITAGNTPEEAMETGKRALAHIHVEYEDNF